MIYPDNPILTFLGRGGFVESVHRGAWVATRASGDIISGVGDPQQLIFPRSASKSLQAIPLIESGAADAFGFGGQEIALALASHNGEAQHLEVVARMLAAAGLDERHLLCGPQAPRVGDLNQPATRLLNNCSGKHAGFLATAVHRGLDPKSYLDPKGELQKEIHLAVEELAGTPELTSAIDGCGAPTFRLPLASLATAIARLTSPADLAPERQRACRRITAAGAAYPDLVGGIKGRIDSDIMRVTSGRIFAKIGAEGVFVVGAVEGDVGLAIKVDDGNERGFDYYLISLLKALDLVSADEFERLTPWNDSQLRNWDGFVVGEETLTPFPDL